MNIYLISRKKSDWCEDYSMVVIAKDKLHAERKARFSSDDFEKESKDNLKIKLINTDKEQCVLKANIGG